MKKVSFALVACITLLMATLFVSCGDDDGRQPENSITGLELPKSDADNPIQSGQTVEIKGTGFASSCEVWLQPVATRTEPEVVKVDVTVTSTGISFVVPTLTGKYDVILKQNGESYKLGTLFLVTPVDESVEHLFAASVNDDAKPISTTFYEYDPSMDKFTEYGTVDGDLWKVVLAGENGMVYYFKDEGLFSYDMKAKSEKQILDEHWLAKMDKTGTGQAIGIVDGKLHGVKYSQKSGFTLVQISVDGKETVVKEFPAFAAAEGSGNADFFCDDDFLIFMYDEANKAVVVPGLQEIGTGDDTDAYPTIVSLDMTTLAVNPKWSAQLDWYGCLNVNGQLWLSSIDEKKGATIEQVNPLTWKTGQAVEVLSKYNVLNPVFSKSLNAVCWSQEIENTFDKDKVMMYDVATEKVTESKATLPYIDCLFAVKY
ncbi:IPT/TIG domain-containing protein [Bacteroides sp.]